MIAYKTLSKIQAEPALLFSICTMVNNQEEYAIMKQTFEACGFNENCEYLIADNTASNQFDAYEAISRFIKESQGKYLIIVHQDVRCIDRKEDLLDCINNLNLEDNKWAICGNAGCMGHHLDAYYITNKGKIIKHTNLPARVYSLDENLLIIKKSANLSISSDLKGFHLYGTDLCIIADFFGYSCYVIPFMVKHLSGGNVKEVIQQAPQFVAAYGKKLRSRYIQTTCTKFYLSCSVFNNKLYNFPLIFFFVKAYQRLKSGIKILTGEYPYKKTVSNETDTTS